MLPTPPFDFLPSEYRVKLVTEPWERRAQAALRRRVFCEEQGIFTGHDRDAIDEHAMPLVALSCLHGMPDQVVGTVRIHRSPEQRDHWWGSRLAVHPDYRCVARLGTELIRLAVCTAHAQGCELFSAHVQVQNVRLFRRLHWHTVAEIDLHGRAHHLMRADLDRYPPFAHGEIGCVTIAQSAA